MHEDHEAVAAVLTFTEGVSAMREVAEYTVSGANIGAAVSATHTNPGETALDYTLSGTDAASFAIDDSSGQLQTGAALDHESKASYLVTVRVEDSAGVSATIEVTINVTDVNEPPAAPRVTGVSAVSGNDTQLSVTWNAPANTGRPAISDYDVRYCAGTPGTAVRTATSRATITRA